MRLVAIAMLALAAPLMGMTCGDADDPSDAGSGGGVPAERKIEKAPIDELELIVRESFPPQYAARIVSGLPNGCAQFNEAKVTSRSGGAIEIEVTNTVPSDPNTVCTAIYGMHEEIVELGSDLVSGTEYTVRVNDKDLKFTAQ